MKTEETINAERELYFATRKIGVFGCFEVTIGFFGKERVDYMTYDTKGIFRCYEVKVTKADFHSSAVKSFVGHYNYYVITNELYSQVKDEIPAHIGVIIKRECVKAAKKQDIDSKTYSYRRSIGGRSTEITIPYTEMLKDSLIRSLYHNNDKIFLSGDEVTINRYNRKIEAITRERDRNHAEYVKLFKEVSKEYGHDKAYELLQR